MVLAMIEFRKTLKQAKIRSPLKNFEEETIAFEYRTDPLTERNTTVIEGMLDYVNKFLLADKDLLISLVKETQEGCPFCPENILTKTPMFTADFFPEGRITEGETTVVPNLLGHAEQSILGILSKSHHLKLEDFTPELISNGFKGATRYLKLLHKSDSSIQYPAFAFNYLTPAGSSIFHPHMQILVRDRPFYLLKLMLNKSEAYFLSNRTNYWSDLLVLEKNGPRYLFGSDGVEWLVPFAPLRGMNEIQAVVLDKSNFLELAGKEWNALAEGLSKILKFYESQGYSSFNIIIGSGPMNQHLDYFNVNLRIITRPGVQKWSFTDAWAAPYLLWDGEAVEKPEEFAERIKTFLEEI
jgi:UDPglucose--hexose-1-phosphate uridylyltransferase